jgi:hypothetical protein
MRESVVSRLARHCIDIRALLLTIVLKVAVSSIVLSTAHTKIVDWSKKVPLGEGHAMQC